MKRLASILLGLTLLLAVGCGTLRRAGKDLFICITSPGVILYGASTDAAADVQNIQKGLQMEDWAQPFFWPFAFLYRTVEHTGYIVVHAVDLVGAPFYALAEINDFAPEIRPLQIYNGTWFDEWAKEADREAEEAKSRARADLETGEEK